LQTNTRSLALPDTAASIAQSSQVTSDVLAALKDCPTRSYVVFEQWGVSADDFVDGRSAPRLSQYMGHRNKSVKTTLAVSDVIGRVDSRAISAYLKSNCGHKTNVRVGATPGADKAQRMRSLQLAGMHT
jgi:hypothetical protein